MKEHIITLPYRKEVYTRPYDVQRLIYSSHIDTVKTFPEVRFYSLEKMPCCHEEDVELINWSTLLEGERKNHHSLPEKIKCSHCGHIYKVVALTFSANPITLIALIC